MKKLFSLIRASMTNGMSLIKINSKNKLLMFFIPSLLMFSIGSGAYEYFKILSPTHMQYVLLVTMVLGVSLFTLIEGVYKTSSLLFNCNDDQLLLSLPIKRRTILFVRIFKFYVFEMLFNSLFIVPFMISYIFWAEKLTWTYFLVSVIMLIMLPVIPVVLSCFIGFIITSFTNNFKHKNFVQTIVSFIFVFGVMYLSFNLDKYVNYLSKHASSINNLIAKIYYPAGVYGKLITNFNCWDLLIFIGINILILILAIYLMSKFYFKFNSQSKKVSTNLKNKDTNLVIKRHNSLIALIKKEIKTFFSIPVLIINSGFALLLFIAIVIMASIKFDALLSIIKGAGIVITKDYIMSNISVFIFILISLTAYMTSITNSLISLEGKSINILKSLPINSKTILMSKIIACLLITTPVLLIGNIVLFIKFNIPIIEGVFLLFLSILVPLVSHFIGLIINLKYPKLDASNSTEVVKQSTSSLLSVFLGILLLILTVAIVIRVVGKYSALVILLIALIIYGLINLLLYLYLSTKGVQDFNKLSL